jgi:hypothetical protein
VKGKKRSRRRRWRKNISSSIPIISAGQVRFGILAIDDGGKTANRKKKKKKEKNLKEAYTHCCDDDTEQEQLK